MTGWQKIMLMGRLYKIKPVSELNWGAVADIVVSVQQSSFKGTIYDDYFDVVLIGEKQINTVYPTLRVGDLVFISGKVRKRRMNGRTFLSILCESIDRVMPAMQMQQFEDMRTSVHEEDDVSAIIDQLEENWRERNDPDIKE